MSVIRYQEYHFENVQDVGVAFNNDRVWVCFNGIAVLRAKAILNRKNPALFLEYNPDQAPAGDVRAQIEKLWLGLNKVDRAEIIEDLQRGTGEIEMED